MAETGDLVHRDVGGGVTFPLEYATHLMKVVSFKKSTTQSSECCLPPLSAQPTLISLKYVIHFNELLKMSASLGCSLAFEKNRGDTFHGNRSPLCGGMSSISGT